MPTLQSQQGPKSLSRNDQKFSMHSKSTLILIHLVNYESRKSVDWTDFVERLAPLAQNKETLTRPAD